MNCPKISPELAEISRDLTDAQRRLAEIADKRVAQRGRIKRAQDVLARLDADDQAVRDTIDGLTQALISRARIEAGDQRP